MRAKIDRSLPANCDGIEHCAAGLRLHCWDIPVAASTLCRTDDIPHEVMSLTQRKNFPMRRPRPPSRYNGGNGSVLLIGFPDFFVSVRNAALAHTVTVALAFVSFEAWQWNLFFCAQSEPLSRGTTTDL